MEKRIVVALRSIALVIAIITGIVTCIPVAIIVGIYVGVSTTWGCITEEEY